MTEPEARPEDRDAIRELVRLLRVGYQAYLESRRPAGEEATKCVDSKSVRDSAA